jgi:hypothetical protein
MYQCVGAVSIENTHGVGKAMFQPNAKPYVVLCQLFVQAWH